MNSNNQEINVDEIMEKIRQEVEKNHNKNSNISSIKDNQQYQTPIELRKLCMQEFGNSDPLKHEVKATYHIDDFLKCNNDEFIQKAFNLIYAEIPGPIERNNLLKRLEKGLSREYILGRMRYSSRGRKIGARIKGLTFSFFVHSFYRLPLAGNILRMILILIRLPRALSDISLNLTGITNHIDSSSRLFNNDLNTTLKEVETAINTLITFRNNDFDKLNNLSHIVKNDFSQITNQLNILKEEAEKDGRKLQDFMTLIETKYFNQFSIPDEIYFELEKLFRGTREDIKKRQELYLEIVKAAHIGNKDTPILDIGCGRGEWLELCAADKLKAFGIDTNNLMVSQCREFGLNVFEENALEYLKKQKSSSIGAITGFHFAEHIPIPELIYFLIEAFRVLKPNGMLLLETPNPENLIVGACSFYFDPTHVKPIPPRLLEHLLNASGFVRIELRRVNLNNNFVNSFNNDVDTEFAKLFSGSQDYSIMGFKN